MAVYIWHFCWNWVRCKYKMAQVLCRIGQSRVYAVYIRRVGQNHIYTVCIRYFWQGNHHIYSHIRCIYTVLANPIYTVFLAGKSQNIQKNLAGHSPVFFACCFCGHVNKTVSYSTQLPGPKMVKWMGIYGKI